MNKVILVVLFILFRKCNSLVYTDQYGVHITYKVTFKSTCRTGKDKFRTILGVGLSDCVRECGLRPYCEALSYQRHQLMCALYSTADGGDTSNEKCTYIPAIDITVEQTPCAICQHGQVCDRQSGNCIYEECVSTNINNGEILGNMKGEGNRIRYKCNYGYRERDGTDEAVCRGDGNWTAVADCERVCLNQPAINNGMATLDKANGNMYMDTATVSCGIGYNMSVTTVKCTASGDWENATCDPLGCYVNNVWDYVGTWSFTKTGYACDRWDNHIGHQYVNVQYLPESSISDAENYCRNPTSNSFPLWCFTTNPSSSTYYEHCNITQC